MLKKLKHCKNLREIYETIPELFYEKGSFIMILLLLLMIVAETASRYITRHTAFNEMVNHFYYSGYVMIAFAVVVLAVKYAGAGKSGVKEYFKQNPYDLLLMLVLILGFVSALHSHDRNTAFLGNWFRQSGFRTYLIYASAYVCGKNIKQQTTRLNLYFAFAIVSTIQNLLLITQHFGYYGSKTGAFYNANHSGYFITISLFAMIGLAALDKRLYMKIMGMVLFGINVWCLIINNTFGCYLAVIAGLVFLLTVSFFKNKSINYMVIISVILFLAVSLWMDARTNVISNNFGVTTKDIGKIANGSEDAGHAGTGRWELWVNVAKYVAANPLFGSGPDCLGEIEKRTVDKNAGEGVLSEPHNEYLQYAAEIGIPAAVCYIVSLVLIFIFGMKKIKKSEDSLIYDGAVVFAYCVSAFFGVVMFYTAVFFFFFLGMSSGRHA